MKSFRQIENIVGRAQAQTGRPLDERVLTDAVNALTPSSSNRLEGLRPGPALWRFIMEHKVTRYSATAAIMVAAALVLVSPWGNSKHGSIVWADVAEKVGEMHTLIHKEKRVGWEIGKEETVFEAEAVRYASDAYGIADHQYDVNGVLMLRAYFLKETKQFIIVFPGAKKYLKAPLSGELFDRLTSMLTPSGLVAHYTAGKYTELGCARIDNSDAHGFEITDPDLLNPLSEPLRSMIAAKDLVGRMWIDAQTSLPVSTEIEFNTGRGLLTGFKRMHCDFKAYDLQWNTEIPEGMFDPNIPDDYTEFKATDFIPTETKAGLLGLGLVPVGFFIWRRRKTKQAAAQS